MNIKISPKLSLHEKNFIKFIEEDEGLVFYIRHLRKMLNIPDDGLTKESSPKMSIEKIQQLERYTNSLLDRLGLANSWYNCMESILLFNYATPRNEIELKLYPSSNNYRTNDNQELHVIIKEKISRDRLKKLLYDSKYKDQLDFLLGELPSIKNLSRITIQDKHKIITENQAEKTNWEISEELGYSSNLNRTAGIKHEYKKHKKDVIEKMSPQEKVIQTMSLD